VGPYEVDESVPKALKFKRNAILRWKLTIDWFGNILAPTTLSNPVKLVCSRRAKRLKQKHWKTVKINLP